MAMSFYSVHIFPDALPALKTRKDVVMTAKLMLLLRKKPCSSINSEGDFQIIFNHGYTLINDELPIS